MFSLICWVLALYFIGKMSLSAFGQSASLLVLARNTTIQTGAHETYVAGLREESGQLYRTAWLLVAAFVLVLAAGAWLWA